MQSSLTSVLPAARDAAGAQHYPPGALYIVATPIGNLADITLRALHVLQLVDAVACEDTRHTAPLLQAYGIERPLVALHQHNEAEAAAALVQRLLAGQRIAYVSDAGTPAISDPGARLVAAARAAGVRVLPLPGASSVTALLSAAGVAERGDFIFVGFLPSKAGERQQAVQQLAGEARAQVLLEAPHRIGALALALAVLGARRVTVGRELTKQFEEIDTLAAADLPAWLAAHPQRQRGEFVLALHPAPAGADGAAGAGLGVRALRLLMAELPLKTAVKLAAELSGEPRNALYDEGLRIKRGDAGEPAAGEAGGTTP
ncbi:MAG: 16S rRNA (cytidine(1402)-2'-O)-methyltransferase [Comamonas sp.]